MRLDLTRKLALGYAAARVVLGIVGMGAIRGAVRWREHAAEVDRAHEVLARLASLLSAVVDVETDARGFALTGDESFLAPRRQGGSRIDADLLGLEGLSTDDPRQAAGVGELRSLVAERLRLAGRVIDLRRSEAGRRSLQAQAEELRRWQRATVGREERVLELKSEVNELLHRVGLPARYPSVTESGAMGSGEAVWRPS